MVSMKSTHTMGYRRFASVAVGMLFLSVGIGCQSVNDDWENLEDAAHSVRLELGTSAISVAVFDSASILEQVTLGTQSVESDEPVDDRSPWHLGSCTKAMTATMIGRLVDRGVLSFSTSIGDVFSEEIHPGFSEVTLGELLRHRGGTTGAIYQSHPKVWEAMWQDAGGDAREVRRNAVLSLLATFPARSVGTYTYSNAGFMVAAALAEEITETNWQELMRSELFIPLGMISAGFGAPAGDAPWPHRWSISRHEAVDPSELGADNPPSLGPAGTVHASLADWIRFLQLFIGGGPPGFLSMEVLDDLLRPSKQAIGENVSTAAGWFVVERNWAGGRALTHAGSNTMNYALVWLAPARERGIVIATNGARPSTERVFDRLAGWIISRYIASDR